jgi:hypothetical protein
LLHIQGKEIMSIEEHLPDFTGKAVAFYVTTMSNAPDWVTEGIMLESPYFLKQGNRLFLKGQTPEAIANESDWSADREAGLAWDSVFYYVVMTSEEYQAARLQESDDSKGESDDKKDVAVDKKLIRKYLARFSLIVMGVLIPTALLIGIIVWIVKMIWRA